MCLFRYCWPDPLEEDLEKSDTAKATLEEFTNTKKFVGEVIDEIEKEANSISKVI